MYMQKLILNYILRTCMYKSVMIESLDERHVITDTQGKYVISTNKCSVIWYCGGANTLIIVWLVPHSRPISVVCTLHFLHCGDVVLTKISWKSLCDIPMRVFKVSDRLRQTIVLNVYTVSFCLETSLGTDGTIFMDACPQKYSGQCTALSDEAFLAVSHIHCLVPKMLCSDRKNNLESTPSNTKIPHRRKTFYTLYKTPQKQTYVRVFLKWLGA